MMMMITTLKTRRIWVIRKFFKMFKMRLEGIYKGLGTCYFYAVTVSYVRSTSIKLYKPHFAALLWSDLYQSDDGRWSTNYQTLSRVIRDSERLSLRLSIIYNTQCTCRLRQITITVITVQRHAICADYVSVTYAALLTSRHTSARADLTPTSTRQIKVAGDCGWIQYFQFASETLSVVFTILMFHKVDIILWGAIKKFCNPLHTFP